MAEGNGSGPLEYIAREASFEGSRLPGRRFELPASVARKLALPASTDNCGYSDFSGEDSTPTAPPVEIRRKSLHEVRCLCRGKVEI